MKQPDVILKCITIAEREFQILDIFMNSARIQPCVMKSLDLPEVDNQKGIIINGRAPIWLYAYIVQQYREAKWIATYDPKEGAIIVISNSSDRNPGEIIPTTEVLPYLPIHSSKAKKVIAFIGPPHSGKSVLMNAIRIELENKLPKETFERDFYVLRACPDGEGNWFSEIPESQRKILRYKNRFDDNFVNEVCDELQKLRDQKSLLFVDCGGKIDKKNQRILNLCTHAIIVSSDPNQIPVWRGLALSSELEVLAEIQSVNETQSDIISPSPFLIRLGKLERGSEKDLNIPEELLSKLLN